MTAVNSALATRIAQEHAAAEETLPASVVSRDRRRIAMAALTKLGLPTSRDENWKYANLRPLERVRFTPATQDAGRAAQTSTLPPPIAGHARYTFVDGVFSPQLSFPVELAGVTVRSMRLGSAAAPAGSDALVGADARFALLNDAFAIDGACIRVAAGTDCEPCLEIVFAASADAKSGASYPRVELQVEAGARFGLIERHLSLTGDGRGSPHSGRVDSVGGGSAANFVNGSVNIELGRGSSVKHYRVQQMGAQALWFDSLSASVAEDAVYRLYSVGLGALAARSTVNIRISGERADVGVYAADVADRQQNHDTFVLVDHATPRARTEQTFRGVAAGRARVAFNSKVIVRKDAHGTDSRQSLRGLLAGAEAEIDVRPQLEIYTDDVKCSHGATAGKLDDNMLFYMLSRGLDRDTAQRLLKWAFLEDVVARIEVPELRRQIEQSLAGQLNETAVLQGAPYTAHGQLHEQLPRGDGERATPTQKELL